MIQTSVYPVQYAMEKWRKSSRQKSGITIKLFSRFEQMLSAFWCLNIHTMNMDQCYAYGNV